MFINTKFILASSSKSRRSLLKNVGLSFYSINPKCNEELLKKKLLKAKKKPKAISSELSKAKAKSISNLKRKLLVVGCDTVIDFKGVIIDKARNIESAKKKIRMLSGKTHTIYSSISVYKNNNLVWKKTIGTKVRIRKLKTKEVDDYFKRSGKEVLQSVGCYQIEKRGPEIIQNIRGDFFNVMGFPLFDFLFFLKNNEEKK